MSFAVRPSQTLVSMQEVHVPKEEEEEQTSSNEEEKKSYSTTESNFVKHGRGSQTSTTLKISGSSTSTYDFS
jgi:hypothetical protein